ncbi:MAG: hypothetical protein II694_02870 [Lachnospiraceae bacterium]|nr:hypothetical protein [Lachnospiraceae bacterium]
MGKIEKIRLTPAKCAVDLGDGSERGFYVDQDYILNKLGRPHRAINLMYCYYPLDKEWPARAQDAFSGEDVGFAWDYPYDNYFPYRGGLEGDRNGEPFTCMKDIRRHGQDVILTLTCDTHVSDEQIAAIAEDLKPYGRMMLRLNHECTGDWFSYTKRSSYREIADFFVRFKRILNEHAPQVKIILCAGQVSDLEKPELEMEDIFFEAGKETDIWSIDNYIALNWGWPYEVAEKNNNSHKLTDCRIIFEQMRATYKRYVELYGVKKPLVMSELNADGDVAGPYKQAAMMKEFYGLVKNDPDRSCAGITLYQFRDDGRLGLEFTDPNNPANGIEWPLLSVYRDIIDDDFFKPGIVSEGRIGEVSADENGDVHGAAGFEQTLRWGGAEDAEGVEIELAFEGNPVFAEANFKDDLKNANLMLELNGRWFYKAPGATFVDFMPAFYGKDIPAGSTLKLRIFAPPADGVNDPSQGENWLENYYYTLKSLPDIRLRFEPVI